ncbi:hypothetical protein BCR35DRAFT_298027 [Leucosporidium creatinivorum]|uniref:Uncharacterized protein n=1 Tax=Leucosporidium creatinivorum TaxID=106004 RepID=A0A1Y2G7M4_9BASI|nr:hypothetical protein BCR35DRAFT_298027 [Leucosporidium creatinivorum]
MATPFTTFATPSRSSLPPSPLPSTKRRSYPPPLSAYSSDDDSQEDAESTPSRHHFTFLCTPPSRSPSSSLSPHHLTSTPMRRSPGMCNLNFFTRSAFAEDSKTSGVEAWRQLGAHSTSGLGSPGIDLVDVRAGTPDSGFFSSPELPSSPSSDYSSASSSSDSSYSDDDDSDPSTSLDWERLTHASTPPTPYTPFTCTSTPASFKSPSPADPRQQLARLQLVASPRLAGLQEEQQRRVGGSWEVEASAGVGLGLGLAF